MKQKIDFANLTDKQRINLTRQIKVKKDAWLQSVYANLVKDRVIPEWVWFFAHSTKETKQLAASNWLKENGYELLNLMGANDLGAVLKCRGKVIAKLSIDVEKKALLKSEGNVQPLGHLPDPEE